MKVFNSLGSNYQTSDVVAALLGGGKGAPEVLTRQLGQRYGGKVQLVYKGREALVLAIQALDLPEGSTVAITGFTCYAVYKAVASAGTSVQYLDINKSSLNFSAKTLEDALKDNPDIKAVVVQNTLGFACDIAAISAVCQQHDLALIEDLAHSLGAHYPGGREVGTVGDMVMLSFGRDKIVDAVAGGALIVRNPKYQLPQVKRVKPPLGERSRDRQYPMLSTKVRRGYQIGIGKYLHALYKALGLMSRSVDSDFYGPMAIANWQAKLASNKLNLLNKQLEHRRTIAELYAKELNPSILFSELVGQLGQATNLRFPILVQNRATLLKHLSARGIFVADIWYDAPISPVRYMSSTNYRGQCPESEEVCKSIINLPTHQLINQAKAHKIVQEINQWLQSQ